MAAVCKRNEPKEILGLNRITKKRLLELCKKDKLYQTPALNDVLYLHYQGFQCIECLDDYTELKCLWLECNAISEIQGLENQTKLKCLFLQSNLIKKIENLEWCKELDTINLSQNHIRKIENIGADILPVLNTLNLSANYIKDCEGLRNLEECKNLSVLDLSNNRIDDILVVKIFAKMPELKVLILQGNPVVSKIPQYRKTMILECKNLTYLDARPVFPKDRACAEAWKRGGYEEERKENERWNRKDRKKIRDSVNATIRMRNKHRKPEDHLTLLASSDSEDESAASKRRRQQQELDAGINMELGIWDEVAGGGDGKSETASSSDMNVSSSTSVISTTDSNADNTSSSSMHEDNTAEVGEDSSEQYNNLNISKDRSLEGNICLLAESGNAESILQIVKDKKEEKNLDDCLTVKKISLGNLTESKLQSLRDNEKKEDQSEVMNLVYDTELRREDDNEKQCDLIFKEDRDEVKLLNCPAQENNDIELGNDGVDVSTQETPHANVSDEDVISSDEGPDVKESYNDTIEAIYRVTMNDLSHVDARLKYSERLGNQQIATNDDNYEVVCEMEEAMGTMINDEDKTTTKIRELNSKTKGEDYKPVKTQLQLEYDQECSIVNEEVQKDFEQMSSNMDVAMAQFQREEEERKQVIEALFSKREADKEISSGGESGDGDVAERNEDMLRIERMVDQWDRETRLRGGRLRKDNNAHEEGEKEEVTEIEVGHATDDRKVNFRRRKLEANKEEDFVLFSSLMEKEEKEQESGPGTDDRNVNSCRRILQGNKGDFESSSHIQEKEDGGLDSVAEAELETDDRKVNSYHRKFQGIKEGDFESSSSLQEIEEHKADDKKGNSRRRKFGANKEGDLETSSRVQEKENDVRIGKVEQIGESFTELKGKENTEIPLKSIKTVDVEYQEGKEEMLCSKIMGQWHNNDRDIKGSTENPEITLKQPENNSLDMERPKVLQKLEVVQETHRQNEIGRKIESEFAEKCNNNALDIKESKVKPAANLAILENLEELQENCREKESCLETGKRNMVTLEENIPTDIIKEHLRVCDKTEISTSNLLSTYENNTLNTNGNEIQNFQEYPFKTTETKNRLPNVTICPDDDFAYQPLDISLLAQVSNQALDSFEREAKELKHLLQKLENDNEQLFKDINAESKCENEETTKEVKDKDKLENDETLMQEGNCSEQGGTDETSFTKYEHVAKDPIQIICQQTVGEIVQSLDLKAQEPKSYESLKEMESKDPAPKEMESEDPDDIIQSQKPKSYEFFQELESDNPDDIMQSLDFKAQIPKNHEFSPEFEAEDPADIIRSLKPKCYEFPQDLESEDPDDVIQSLDLKIPKPKSYEFPKELESDDSNSSSRKPITELPLTQTIRGVIDSFNEVFATRRSGHIHNQSNERKRVPSTTLDKVVSLNKLVNQSNLTIFNQDTHESLDNLLEEYKEERSNEIRQMVDRVYAQKERYNDTIELIDGKLMVVNQATGELTELSQSQAQNTSDSDSDATDYDTAESGNEEGACCSKPKLRNRVKVWPRKWGPFTSADYKPAVELMHHALASNQITGIPKAQCGEKEESESEEFYSLDPQTKPSSVYANIDEAFFDNITFEQLKLSEDDDENHIVQCARSYEELKHLFNVSHEDKSLTTEEHELLADIQKKMQIRNEFQGSKDRKGYSVTQDDLLQKLMTRTRETQVRKAGQQQAKPTSPNDYLATEKTLHRSSGDAIKIFEYNSGLNIDAREECEEQQPDTGICETLDNVYSFMYKEEVSSSERAGSVSSRSTLQKSKQLKESLNRKEQLEKIMDSIQYAVGFTTQRSEGEKNELEHNVDEAEVLISNKEISPLEMTYVPSESQVIHSNEDVVKIPNEEISPLEITHLTSVLSDVENLENNGKTAVECFKDTENYVKDALKDEKDNCLQVLGSNESRPEYQKSYKENAAECSNLHQDQTRDSISDDILCQPKTLTIPVGCEPLISKPPTLATITSKAIKETCHIQLTELSEQMEDIEGTTNTLTTDLHKAMLSSNQPDIQADIQITPVDITEDNCAVIAHTNLTDVDLSDIFNVNSSEGSSAEMPHVNATEADFAQLSDDDSPEGSSVMMSHINITEDDAVKQSITCKNLSECSSLELNAKEAKSPEMPNMNTSADNSAKQPDIDILECNLEILDCNEEIIDTITVNAELRYNY